MLSSVEKMKQNKKNMSRRQLIKRNNIELQQKYQIKTLERQLWLLRKTQVRKNIKPQ